MTHADSPFSSIPEILDELRAGRMIILVDDEDRENEGDLVCAAECITPEMINFMIRKAAGKLCLTLSAETCDRLGLHPQAAENTAEHGTAFTVSIDAAPRFGVSTGVSASDRCATILRCLHDDARPADFRRPGHISPLRAREGGVLVRAGHTEASVDLAVLAGLRPGGVIIEVLKEDGQIARLPDLIAFARQHDLKLCSIADLVEHRMRREHLVRRAHTVPLKNEFGAWRLIAYETSVDEEPHLALCMGDIGLTDVENRPLSPAEPALVRVHSQCLTGDVFGSSRCDCGPQLRMAMHTIAEHGSGVIVYLRQEGRGIGLSKKLHAYQLQDEGLDTVEANEKLGFPADKRDYGTGAQILRDLGLTRIRILTNNPKKVCRLEVYGLEVVEQRPLEVPPTDDTRRYLQAKRAKLGHTLTQI